MKGTETTVGQELESRLYGRFKDYELLLPFEQSKDIWLKEFNLEEKIKDA